MSVEFEVIKLINEYGVAGLEGPDGIQEYSISHKMYITAGKNSA